MTVVIIGSGNAATVLGKIIQHAGHTIVQVISRNIHNARELAGRLNARYSDNWRDIADADLYLIAVSDAAIATVSAALQLPAKLILHTSGSVSKDILQNISDTYGVLYPLQSLRKELFYSRPVPLLVDGNTKEVTKQTEQFAFSISTVVSRANDVQRLKLHTAAVIVSNFTNYLYTLAKEFCDEEKTDFSLLYPLIQEVAARIENNNPGEMQTGPATRGDTITIEKHLQLLSAYPALKNIYAILSESIINHRVK